jgi:hypothetical protein
MFIIKFTVLLAKLACSLAASRKRRQNPTDRLKREKNGVDIKKGCDGSFAS